MRGPLTKVGGKLAANSSFLVTSVSAGTLDTVDIHHFEGVVTFPSFHAVMAPMSDMGQLFGLSCIWSGPTLLATMPMSGRYAVDSVAWAVIWSMFTLPHPWLSAATMLPSDKLALRRLRLHLSQPW
jgi:hypothetical protein